MSPQQFAVIIDEYHDSLLYDGMPMFELQFVEEQRAQWHAHVTAGAMGATGFRKLTR